MKRLLIALLLAGCAGWSRDCQSCGASNFGSDWIIVQYRYDGTPINCWMLKGTAVTNEERTDGIYWQAPSGHLVHISGWYNRVHRCKAATSRAQRNSSISTTTHAAKAHSSTANDATLIEDVYARTTRGMERGYEAGDDYTIKRREFHTTIISGLAITVVHRSNFDVGLARVLGDDSVKVGSAIQRDTSNEEIAKYIEMARTAVAS